MKGSLPAELLEVLERSATADFVTIDGRGQPVVVAADAALPGGRGLHRRHGRPACRPTSASRCSSPTPRRWSSCRARAHAEDRGGEEHRRPRAAPSASTSGPAATSRPSRGSTTRTSTRSARRTTRSPRSATRRPRAAAACGTSASTPSAPAIPTPSWPSSAPTGSRSPSASRSRAERDAGLVLVDADPVGAPIEPGLACLCADAPGRRGFHVLGDLDEDRGVWVLRPHRVADPALASAGRLMAGLTVAVTGPTGEIGRAFMRSLERSREVGRIVGMARRPFDPAAHGWKRTEYRRGDVLDRASVEGLVEGADVVVHLAFVVAQGQQRDAPRQRRGLAQRLRGGGRGRRRSGWSTRARSPPTASPRTSTASSPRTCRRSATRATPTPPTRPRSRRSSTRR